MKIIKGIKIGGLQQKIFNLMRFFLVALILGIPTAISYDVVSVTITFVDHGVPYDPLAKEDPDVSLSAEERNVGGLGIFLTKQVMDEVSYEYKHGQNILRIRKKV